MERRLLARDPEEHVRNVERRNRTTGEVPAHTGWLCFSVVALCVADALLATGQPIGIRWALFVFGSAFFSLAIEAKRTPHRSTTQPPARDQPRHGVRPGSSG